MNAFVIEVQVCNNDNIVNFVVRDSRTGVIKSCGNHSNDLISFIESLTKK